MMRAFGAGPTGQVWGFKSLQGRHYGHQWQMVSSNLGVQNVSFSGNFAASRPTETTRRSNRRRRWHSSLAKVAGSQSAWSGE
jgi:hypothetical protein